MLGYIISIIIIKVVYFYEIYEFDKKNLNEKCMNKKLVGGYSCDCWYMLERFDSKYNYGNGDIINQIPVICKMRNKAYHMFD